MTYAKEDWLLKEAVVITRVVKGKTQYRISPKGYREGQVPYGGYYSNWCSTEERAWDAALQRRVVKLCRHDPW